jgi:hypothetical protein
MAKRLCAVAILLGFQFAVSMKLDRNDTILSIDASGDMKAETVARGCPSKDSFTVMIFNLEGRGGNQAQADGVARRASLTSWFEGLCSQADAPHVIMTQEDVAADVNSCYAAVASCRSEHYWWTDENKFGDGNVQGSGMLNKVYVRKSAISDDGWELVGSGVSLDLPHDGFENPRCSATATFEVPCLKKMVSFGSFHLSGGYVDDAAVLTKAKASAEGLGFIQTVREKQLVYINEQLHCSSTACIIGGDTNGFPEAHKLHCQGGRLNGMFKAENKTASYDPAAARRVFENFLSIPDAVGSLRRLNGASNHVPCTTGAETAQSSTTVYGGQPDEFYTNVGGALAQIQISVGIECNQAGFPPCVRKLSDHNPVILTAQYGSL